MIEALQIVGGALLLANRFAPLALVLLGPIIVKIICYHVFPNPRRSVFAAVVTILWFIVFYVSDNTSQGYLLNVLEEIDSGRTIPGKIWTKSNDDNNRNFG